MWNHMLLFVMYIVFGVLLYIAQIICLGWIKSIDIDETLFIMIAIYLASMLINCILPPFIGLCSYNNYVYIKRYCYIQCLFMVSRYALIMSMVIACLTLHINMQDQLKNVNLSVLIALPILSTITFIIDLLTISYGLSITDSYDPYE
jgi:hypothetical protein